MTNLEKSGELVPTVSDPADGSRWYTLDAVLAFAVKWKKTRRQGAPTPQPRTKKPSRAVPPPRVAGDALDAVYNPDPERRAAPRAAAGVSPAVPAPTGRPAPATSEFRAEWFDENYRPPEEPTPPKGPTPPKMMEGFKPEWFNENYQPPSER